MKYQVITAVKPRKTPSMYEVTTKPNLPVALEFTSDTSTKVTEEINNIPQDITFVQMADLYWVPMVKDGIEYVRLVGESTPTEPTDPPVPFPGEVMNLTLEFPGIAMGKVILNNVEYTPKGQ
jgi:hypothetical protein